MAARREFSVGACVALALVVMFVARAAAAGETDLSGPSKAVDDAVKQLNDAQAASTKASKTSPPDDALQKAEDQADKDSQAEAKAEDAVEKASAAKDAAKTAQQIKDAGKDYNEAMKALGPAKEKAKLSEAAAKKAAKGSKYHDAKEKERQARRLLAAALSHLRGALRSAKKNGNKIKDEAGARGSESSGSSALGVGSLPLSMVPFVPNDKTALAALVKSGKVEATATGTGETIGVVANVTLHNKTDGPLDVVIPPTVLVSVDGTTQNYGVPEPIDVVLNPGQTAIVPLNGVCTQAHKPPAGNTKPGNLMIADPTDPHFAHDFQPQLACTQDVVQTAHALQHDGYFHTPFHRDPTKEYQTIVQQTIWAANPSNDGAATTKEDLAKKVYEQVGAKTDEQKKQLQPGIDSIWDAVQLTGSKAKVLNVNNDGGGGQTQEEQQKPPAAASQPAAGGGAAAPTTTSGFGFPKGTTQPSDKTDANGNRAISYTDANGITHSITIDPKGRATETTSKDGKPIGTRHYDVTFDPKTGGRTETETVTSGDSTTTTETDINSKGVVTRSSEFTTTEGKTAEYATTSASRETTYDDDHVKIQTTETKMTYNYNEDFQLAPTGGTRTTTKYSGKGDTKGTSTRETYNPKTGLFGP